MKRVLLAVIGAYQRWISPALPAPLPLRADLLGLRGRVDRAASALLRGSLLAAWRLLRCNPSATAASTRSPTASRCGSGRSTPPSTTVRSARDAADRLPARSAVLIDIADAVLVFFHDDVGLSWGGAIIALTVATRALLIPLTYKQIKGMRALQALQPQIKEIQARSTKTTASACSRR